MEIFYTKQEDDSRRGNRLKSYFEGLTHMQSPVEVMPNRPNANQRERLKAYHSKLAGEA